MYTNYYEQIWSKQFYFQSRKTEISPYIFHRWIWQQAMCGIYMCRAVLCLVTQLHLTLCYPVDCSPSGSSVLGDSPGKNTGVGCHFLLQCMKVKSESEVPQSCPTLRDPMNCSLPGSSVHGIFQARVLEWGAISFSNTHPYNHWNISDLKSQSQIQ